MTEQFAIFRLTKARASGEYADEVRRNGHLENCDSCINVSFYTDTSTCIKKHSERLSLKVEVYY